MSEASRELLAAREDVWGFLAEPFHLSDWWPGVVSVEPDRRGFAEGARWQVMVVADPPRLGVLRLPSIGRPTGPTTRQTLVITAIERYERWAWELVSRAPLRPDKTWRARTVGIRLAYLDEQRTRATVQVGRGSSQDARLATAAVNRLYDLVQFAAGL